jgi:hypothetical protein
MEEAFQDLLRLIGEAAYGQHVECSVTTRAYLRLSEQAARRLIDHAIDEHEEKRLRRCCDYSERYCRRQSTWESVVHFMNRFWSGVEDGFFEKTFRSRGGKLYDHGYKMGKYSG